MDAGLAEGVKKGLSTCRGTDGGRMGETAHQERVGCGQNMGRPHRLAHAGMAAPPSPPPCLSLSLCLSSEFTWDTHLKVGFLEPPPNTYRLGIRKGLGLDLSW